MGIKNGVEQSAWRSVQSGLPRRHAGGQADAPEIIEPGQSINNAPNESVLWDSARVEIKKTRSGRQKER